MSNMENLIDQLASTTVDDEREVSFAGKGLKLDTEDDACEIVEAIKSCSDMTTLCLEGNTIGISAAKAIAKALESQPHFRKALWKDMFTQRTEHEIPDALNYLSSGIILANAHLVELDLSDNAFGPRGLKGIVQLLKSPPCYSLKELRLNNNGLGISGAKMLATALLQCLENSEKDGKRLCLKQFICGRNRLENEGSVALSHFFKAAGTLEHVEMPQNGIYHLGIESLAEAFAKNPELKILNLEDNSFTPKGAKFISAILPTLKSLEVINFGDCLLRDEGAKHIAKALDSSCPLLKELMLGFNEFTAEGGMAIAAALKNKWSLEKLNLNGNQFGPEGCKKITEMLEFIKKSEILGSLSEDESCEDEDDYDEEDSEEEQSGEEDEEEVNDSFISPMNKSVTFSDFFANPSGDSIVQLHRSKISIFPELPENPTYSDYLSMFMKVCYVIHLDCTDNVEKATAYYGEQLLSAAIKLCPEDDMWKFNNCFLLTLSLIKDEEKKLSRKQDLTGALTILKHVVQSSFFPSSTRDVLKLILSRPLKYAVASASSVTALLQKLYQP